MSGPFNTRRTIFFFFFYILQMTTEGICCHLEVILEMLNHSVNDSTHILFWNMAMGQFLKPIFPKVYMSTENHNIKRNVK